MPTPISPGASWRDWITPVAVTLLFAAIAVGVAAWP